MAKPIRIAGLLRRTPIARAASNVLRAVLLDLLEKIPEARGGDSKKGIHDLRVAVKRFREAFRLFRPVL
ncbi:MAG: CHAD domain-containing protein, partial [Betaproteobacteria bacterium]